MCDVHPGPLLLTGRYRLDSPLTVPNTLFGGTVSRLKLRGLNRMSQVSEPYSQSTLIVNHPGTVITVNGEYFEMEGIAIRKIGGTTGVGTGNAYVLDSLAVTARSSGTTSPATAARPACT